MSCASGQNRPFRCAEAFRRVLIGRNSGIGDSPRLLAVHRYLEWRHVEIGRDKRLENLLHKSFSKLDESFILETITSITSPTHVGCNQRSCTDIKLDIVLISNLTSFWDRTWHRSMERPASTSSSTMWSSARHDELSKGHESEEKESKICVESEDNWAWENGVTEKRTQWVLRNREVFVNKVHAINL